MSAKDESAAFSPRSVTVLSILVGASLLGGFLVSVFLDEIGPVRSVGADAFSRSAIGHEAFVRLLERSGLDVLVSRTSHPDVADAEHVAWVFAEPYVLESGRIAASFEAGFEQSARALLVLPKWEGAVDDADPRWVEEVSRVPDAALADVLARARIAGRVVEGAQAVTSWDVPPGWPVPDLPEPQLLDDEDVIPLVSCDEGVLLGVLDDPDPARRRLVLSDPDLIATHGLVRGENAALALAMMTDELVREGDVVVFDETLHGHASEPSLWKSLLGFPLVLAPLHVLLVAAVFLWAALARFGPVAPAPGRLARGKGTLIDNFAALMTLAGHSAFALRRYLRSAMRAVAAVHHVEGDLDLDRTRARLDAIAERRGLRIRTGHLVQAVEEARNAPGRNRNTVAAARRIHRWKRGMIDGAR